MCLCWMEKKTGREFKTMTFSRHEKLMVVVLCDQNYEIMNEIYSILLHLSRSSLSPHQHRSRLSSLLGFHLSPRPIIINSLYVFSLFVSASLTEPTDLPVLNIIVVSGSVHSRQDRSSEGFHETQRNDGRHGGDEKSSWSSGE